VVCILCSRICCEISGSEVSSALWRNMIWYGRNQRFGQHSTFNFNVDAFLFQRWRYCHVVFVFLKADSHIACHAHAVPLPCRAAKGLECVFPI
jgi:hypothetical protein